MELKANSKIAVICRGGPPNTFFSAQCVATLRQGLQINGYDFAGIYAVSGSCPTALLGSINEEHKLCNICYRLTPEDIVTDKTDLAHLLRLFKKFETWRTLMPELSNIADIRMALKAIRRLKEGHIFSNLYLLRLLIKHCGPELDRIFSPDAIPIKIGAVDYLTGQHVIFSNKAPEHKNVILVGALASMGLVPIFPSVTVDDPKSLNLVERTHSKFNSLFLIDGGYRGSLLLEEAIRDPIGYDLIFIIDVSGVEYEDLDTNMPYNLVTRIQRVQSISSATNDRSQLSLVDRIDEEIAVRNGLIQIQKTIHSPEVAGLIDRMNNGRLRLVDKHAPQRIIISHPGQLVAFDFTNFTQAESVRLMQYGHIAALRTLRKLGLNTKEIPLIRP